MKQVECIMTKLTEEKLDFDSESLSGTVVYITRSRGIDAGVDICLTCIGDTHVQVDFMVPRVQLISKAAANREGDFSDDDVDSTEPFDSVAGITLCKPHPAAPSSKVSVTYDTPADPDSACGVTLFRADDVDWDGVDLDSSMGFTCMVRRPAASPAPDPAPTTSAAPWTLWGCLRAAAASALSGSFLQDPDAYTDDQARLSDLAWGASA